MAYHSPRASSALFPSDLVRRVMRAAAQLADQFQAPNTLLTLCSNSCGPNGLVT